MKRCAMHLVALIVALALATVNAQTPGVITQCSDPGVVALTFDDGPSGNTENLLNSLKAADVPATFFILGVQIDQVKNSTDLLQRMYDEGHQLALHTQTHPDLDTLSTSQRRNEMNQVLARVQDAVDLRPNYMRPPFGSCSDSCVTDISAMDYQVVIWNLDSNDWRFRDNGTTPADARAGTRENILSVIDTSDSEQDNFISLQHDTIDYSVSLVPEVINAIRNKGYTFATVADCLNNGIPPYADDDTGDTGDTGYGTADGGDEGDGDGDEDDEGDDDENDKDDEDGKGDEDDENGPYTFYEGIANNTYDNSGNPKPINPKVSQKNSSKSSPNNSTDSTATAASVNNGTESADKADDDADENGVAAIAPHAIIIILSAVLVTMFAL